MEVKAGADRIDVLGISGSPIKNGNIEKIIKAIIANSGLQGKMVRLAEKRVNPCIACLKCAATNKCIQKDDMTPLLEEIKSAKAIIIGGFPTFFSVNSLIKTFTERLYPLKHRYMLSKGKFGISVVAGFRDAEPVSEYLSSVFKWFQMENLGDIKMMGNAPCLSCGVEEECPYSNVRIMFGPYASVSPKMFKAFEEDTVVVDEAKRLGKLLRKKVEDIY